jgi:hypothetical protein
MCLFSEMKGYEGGGKLSQVSHYFVLLPPPPNMKKVFLQIKPGILLVMIE